MVLKELASEISPILSIIYNVSIKNVGLVDRVSF
jgi:hypothetical protein